MDEAQQHTRSDPDQHNHQNTHGDQERRYDLLKQGGISWNPGLASRTAFVSHLLNPHHFSNNACLFSTLFG